MAFGPQPVSLRPSQRDATLGWGADLKHANLQATMRRLALLPLALLFCASALGCSAAGADDDAPGGSGSGSGGGGNGSGGTGSGGTGGGIDIGGNGGTGGDAHGSNCANGTELVYVLGASNVLWSFDPRVNTPQAFKAIGQVGCSAGAGPNSMAIGRDGYAYVAYMTALEDCAGVYKVNIADASCAGPANVKCGQGSGFKKFGMGYATDVVGGSTDKLYLATSTGAPKLGRVDPTTGGITTVGALPGGAEFTGNGNAELWGFFPAAGGSTVRQIDKDTAQVLTSIPVPQLNTNGASLAYAFAFWGGSFYVFFDTSGSGSTVWKVDHDGTVTKWIPKVEARIVGAGVSTCAPVEPPT